MHIEFIHGIVLPAMAAPISLGVAWRSWRLRALPGAIPFVAVALLAAIWSILNAFELSSTDLPGKLLWWDLEYLPIVLMPVAWVVLALDYTGRRSWLTRRNIMLLVLVPLATLAIVWTNRYHHLMRADEWLDLNGSYAALGRSYGPWIWVHLVYSYGAAVTAIGLLVEAARRVPAHYRLQPLILLVGFMISLGWNAAFVLFPNYLPRHDFTPAIFGLSGLVVMWALVRFRLFNLVPVARRSLVENMSDALLVLDEKYRVVDMNQAAQRLMEQPPSGILGRHPVEVWEPWSQLAPPFAAGIDHAMLSLSDRRGRRDFDVKMSSIVEKKHLIGRVLVFHDVTERSLMEASLRRQALTDGLTGLPNRTLFMAKLDDAVRQARRNKSPVFAVVVLDLDRFKLVNDSIGHLAGDYLLESVAAKLKRCVRDVDTVARMGGDEFMILLHGVTTAMDIVPVANRIQAELGVCAQFGQQEIISSASIGVAIWDESCEGSEEILRAADTAMYKAKEAGGSCYRIFDEEMHESVLQALKAELELRSAIKNKDFSLEYQPILDLARGTVCSLEALIRWRHQEQGTILPGEFMKTAESSGLIVPLGGLVLEEVCSQISRWRGSECALSGLPVSVNISPRQLTETDFVASMLAAMEGWRLEPRDIVLELTETALIRDPLRSNQVMRQLREAGMELCLDDFGTGWSSLRHLTTFPVQQLKIDRSFVSKLSVGTKEYQIVKSIINLAHSIGMEVTGEGVEREEQLALLAELGCNRAQGYLIARPMPADALPRYVAETGRADGFSPLPVEQSHGQKMIVLQEEPVRWSPDCGLAHNGLT